MRFGGPGGTTVSGGVSLGSGGVKFLPGKPVSGTITDRKGSEPGDAGPLGADTEAVRATLVFAGGKIQAFKFSADTLRITLGSVLTVTAVDFMLDTGAADDEAFVSFLSVGAEVKVGGIVIGGEMRNFAILGDGSFDTRPGFGVFLSFSGGGEGFKWPSWLPIRINEIGLVWRDIEDDATDFDIILSASITGLPGTKGMKFTGTVDGIRIGPRLLLEGKFPVTDIGAIGVTVVGEVFGGKLTAGLIGGILKLDAAGGIIGPADTATPVADRVFFIGVEGGFEVAGRGGFTIRFAISELGPLGVLVTANIPGGVMLEPNSGLTINDFAGGVEFFKTLPSIDSPFDLRRPEFAVTAVPASDQWLAGVKQQVANQYLQIKADPSRSGFFAAFEAPMTISGSAKIYSSHVSQHAFNGVILIRISTDGKISSPAS